MNKIVILAAGKPHHGTDPSIIFNQNKYFNNFEILKNVFSNYSKNITLISGYKHKILQKKIDAKILFNKNWKKTKSAYSLFLDDFEKSSEMIIVYSDIVFNSKILKKLIESKKQISLISSSKNIKFKRGKEYINIQKNFIRDIGSKLNKKNVNSEFIGLIKLRKKAINELIKYKSKNLDYSNLQISDLVNMLIQKGLSYKNIDIKEDWIELNDNLNNVRKHIINSKANTLKFAKKYLKKSFIYPQISFTYEEWLKNKKKLLKRIKNFSNEIIIRSSSSEEDNFNNSSAGKFLSINNVLTKTKLETKINRVFKSYGNTNKSNQILIQPSAKEIKCNGVVFTSNLDSSFPAYKINLEFKPDDTSSITSGFSENDKVFSINKINMDIKKIKNSIIRKILFACKEIEELFLYESLDIEFAINNQNKVIIFQIRPIVLKKRNIFTKKEYQKNNLKEFDRFNKNLKKLKFKNYLPILLGYMPDWNPAEIIGFKPKNLSLSLYEELITNKIWAKQRDEFGYKLVRNSKLLYNLFGTPFVNVNKTFNSFLPKNINSKLEKKLLLYFSKFLIKNDRFHDKIEFEVVPTYYSLSFNDWKKKLREADFSISEIYQLENGLKKINENVNKVFNDSKLKIKELNENFELINRKKISNNSKIQQLIKECKLNGTLPFSHFARIAFISVSILKDGLKRGYISQLAFNEFFNNLNTVNKTMLSDIRLYKKKKLSQKKFIEKYSHLRPGTYDIISNNYANQNGKILLDILKNDGKNKKLSTKNWNREKLNFLKKIKSQNILNFKTNKEIETFLKISIEYRELSKFYFTKFVNKILELIKKISKKYNLSLDEIAHLNLKDIFSINKNNLDKIKSIIIKNKYKYEINKSYELPHIIKKVEDTMQFEHLKSLPNFIGNFSISKQVVLVKKNFLKEKILKDKIILIESADPGYDWIFSKKIAGLITMFGGANSHMAIRASELNLPAAIGVGKIKFLDLMKSKYINLDPNKKKIEVIK